MEPDPGAALQQLPALGPADLAAVPLFAGLAPHQHTQLLELHRCVAFPTGQTLVLEQDDTQGLFLMRSGLAKVRSINHDGEETVLAVLGPGDLCGDMAVLAPSRQRSADVVTLVPCTVAILRAGPFQALLQSELGLALALARLQAQRLQALNRRYGLGTADATTRLLATLLDLALRSSPGAAATDPIPPLPQRELAVLAGLARETASRTLSKLRLRGTVGDTADGGLQLLDLGPLQRRGLL
jgi:CRP/FNR family cyclic AMP-dependent transcriptional regulator